MLPARYDDDDMLQSGNLDIFSSKREKKERKKKKGERRKGLLRDIYV